MNRTRLLRLAFMAGYFLALPFAGALLLLWALAPSESYAPTDAFGTVLTYFRDQSVPVGILLFTVLEYALWTLRHRLPGAELLAVSGREDVPVDFHADFERAATLLDEAERIMRRRVREIGRELPPAERDELRASLDELRRTMEAEPFEGDAFEGALAHAERHVGDRLGRWRKGELREYTESIGVAVAVALLLRVFVVEAFKIPSGSMIPTLQIGDHIFVNKMAYGPLVPFTQLRLFPNLPPKRGDVMVFEFPENRDQDFIKRVIAIPGDRLEVQDGRPIINGWHVPSCPVGTYIDRENDSVIAHRADLTVEFLEDKAYLAMFERGSAPAAPGRIQGPYIVKPGEVWVLGDNRNNSHDSRSWFGGEGGGVPFANIKGRAMFVWLSIDTSGKFAWDRFGKGVMGTPVVPPSQVAALKPAIDKCLANRPPRSATTPPKLSP